MGKKIGAVEFGIAAAMAIALLYSLTASLNILPRAMTFIGLASVLAGFKLLVEGNIKGVRGYLKNGVTLKEAGHILSVFSGLMLFLIGAMILFVEVPLAGFFAQFYEAMAAIGIAATLYELYI